MQIGTVKFEYEIETSLLCKPSIVLLCYPDEISLSKGNLIDTDWKKKAHAKKNSNL